MNRDQLAHVLRASCQIAGDPHILVIGSQSILGTFEEEQLPAPATASREVDIAFLDDPHGTKADLVDGAIGELSPFDEQFGYYAQGVEVDTAVLPVGWRQRLRHRTSLSTVRRRRCSSIPMIWPCPSLLPIATRTVTSSPPSSTQACSMFECWSNGSSTYPSGTRSWTASRDSLHRGTKHRTRPQGSDIYQTLNPPGVSGGFNLITIRA